MKKRMVSVMALIFSGLLYSLLALAAPTPARGGMRSVVATLQQQIQNVQASVPRAVQQQTAVIQKQITQLHAQMQKQISILQKQIQQVQNQTNKEIKQLQKEIHEVALIKWFRLMPAYFKKLSKKQSGVDGKAFR